MLKICQSKLLEGRNDTSISAYWVWKFWLLWRKLNLLVWLFSALDASLPRRSSASFASRMVWMLILFDTIERNGEFRSCFACFVYGWMWNINYCWRSKSNCGGMWQSKWCCVFVVFGLDFWLFCVVSCVRIKNRSTCTVPNLWTTTQGEPCTALYFKLVYHDKKVCVY